MRGVRPARLKAVSNSERPVKPKVCDDRISRQLFNADAAFARQRMVGLHDYRAVPVIARQHDEIVVQVQRFGGDGEIGGPFGDRFSDLRRRALMHVQRDARVTLDEAFDYVGQGVASPVCVVATYSEPCPGRCVHRRRL